MKVDIKSKAKTKVKSKIKVKAKAKTKAPIKVKPETNVEVESKEADVETEKPAGLDLDFSMFREMSPKRGMTSRAEYARKLIRYRFFRKEKKRGHAVVRMKILIGDALLSGELPRIKSFMHRENDRVLWLVLSDEGYKLHGESGSRGVSLTWSGAEEPRESEFSSTRKAKVLKQEPGALMIELTDEDVVFE